MKGAALLLCALLIAPLAHAEPPVLAVAGKQVPLPAGNWIVAGRAAGALAPASDLGGDGTIWNLVLLRLSDGAVDAVAELNVNDLAVDDGWGMAADCQRHDLALAVVRSSGGWDAACFFIARTKWRDAAALPPAWRQAMALAAERGWTLPADTITAGFRAANRRDVIDVRFHFRDRRGLAFDSDIAAWSAMMIGCVEAGLKNRLPASFAAPMPGVDDSTLQRSGDALLRQRRLAALLAAGVLSQQQYAEQLALLRQQEAAVGQDAIDPGTQEFYRLLSFQGLSVASDAVVTFLWTAQSVQAAALTLLQAGLRTGRSYIAAYLWNWYGSAPTRPDVARTVDFAYGATER
jgi:hypothetical protein